MSANETQKMNVKNTLDALEKSLSVDENSIERDPFARDLFARLRAERMSLWFLPRLGDYPKTIESLLVVGARPNEVNDRGETPLHVAAAEGRVGTVRAILERPDARPDDLSTSNVHWGRTPLFRAAENGHSDVVRVLLTHPAVNPNKTAVDGKTALHVAAHGGHVDVVTCLARDERTNPNARDRARKTPLHVVAERGTRATAYALLENGRDVNVDAISNDRETPVSIAEGRGDVAMATTLREYRPEEENLRDHLRRIENEKRKELDERKTAAIARAKKRIHDAHAARTRGVENGEVLEKRRKRRDEAVDRATETITEAHKKMISRVREDIRAVSDPAYVVLTNKRRKREEDERLWCVSDDEFD